MDRYQKTAKPNFVTDVMAPMFRQELRRIRASAASFMTTSIATAVVLALFVYIFGDFFREKLPEIDTELARVSLFYIKILVIVAASLVISQFTAAKVLDQNNWLVILSTWGVDQKQITKYRRNIALVASSILILSSSIVIDLFFDRLSPSQWLLTAAMIPIGVLRFSYSNVAQKSEKIEMQRSGLDVSKPALIAWRLSRIAQPRWPGWSLRILAAIPITLGTIALFRGQAVELGYLSSLAGGILLSWTVPLLIDDDLKTAWIERQAAVSHADWILSWQSIFTKWAIRIFTTTCVLYALASIAGVASKSLVTSSQIWLVILTNGFLAAFPVWLAPSFVMQIDGKKPVTNMIVMTLIAIFAGSAVIALPIAAPLVFLLQREAHRYQGGRFARGAYH